MARDSCYFPDIQTPLSCCERISDVVLKYGVKILLSWDTLPYSANDSKFRTRLLTECMGGEVLEEFRPLVISVHHKSESIYLDAYSIMHADYIQPYLTDECKSKQVVHNTF